MAQAIRKPDECQVGVGGVPIGKSLNYGRRHRKEKLFKYLTNRRYSYYRDIYTLAKDNPRFLYQLNSLQSMPIHTGCVNTICWNKTGEYILSGSDDSNLCITKPDNLFDNNGHYTVLHKVQTRHLGNIFSAHFMPNSSDSVIVSCSSEGPVIVHDLYSENPSQGIYTFNCHSSTVFEAAVLPDDDNVFLSCGKDKTVRLFDLRCHRSCARAGTCPHPALIRNSHAITTLSIHPLNSNLLLVGRADGIGLVYDRRKLPDVSKFSREKAHLEYLAGQLNDSGSGRDTLSMSDNNMFKFMHPLDGVVSQFYVPGMEEKCNFTSLCYSANGQQVLASYSQDYVYLFNVDKSSNFELIQTLPKKNSNQGETTTTGSNNSENSTLTDQESLQNQTITRENRDLPRRAPRIRVRGDWSDTGIYSVPMREEISEPIPVPSNFLNRMTEVAYTIRSGSGASFLPYSQVIAGPIESNNNQTMRTGQNVNHSEEDSFDFTQEGMDNDDERGDEFDLGSHDDNDESNDEDEETTDSVNNKNERATRSHQEELNVTTKRARKKTQVSHATKMKFQNLRNNLRNKYGSIQTYHPRVCYQGHRNSRTLIKESVFWGEDYIMSGSDDGRIMVWEKNTARLVMSFQGDNRVVNCLAPNPYYYCLASSGIDYDVKLWSTQNIREAPLRLKQTQMEEIVRNNELMLEEAKQTITVPPHLFFRVLASFAQNNRRL